MESAPIRINRLYPTKNDLPENSRRQLVELLNKRLADAIDLQTQMKQAHWNVKGRDFIALHELFDKIYESVSEYVDLIAERAAQLGGQVIGTARAVAKASTIHEYPLQAVSAKDHISAVSSALAAFGKVARKAIDQSDELKDRDTADIFTEISRGTDQWLWFVESHLIEK